MCTYTLCTHQFCILLYMYMTGSEEGTASIGSISTTGIQDGHYLSAMDLTAWVLGSAHTWIYMQFLPVDPLDPSQIILI